MNRLICGDVLTVLPTLGSYHCIFADIPDNIGLKYNTYKDKKNVYDYLKWIEKIIDISLISTKIFWLSFNAKWTAEIGSVIHWITQRKNIQYKPCIQYFTFGQHNKKDFGNNHRPIWRIYHKDAKFYPDNVREPSWRLKHGDKRANPLGRVPGDVFEVPRVTGNSKQRRKWIPTQLNTNLLKKIVLFSSPDNGLVLDLCAGSGSMLRAAKETHRQCDLIEIDRFYCEQIAKEHNMVEISTGIWE